MKKIVTTCWKGLCIGGTMLVPGVSGGSMAMILGIYDKLIVAVSSFFEKKKENFLFLLTFVISSLIGMVLFARPILSLIEAYPMPMLYFFIGAVLGGVPLICKQSGTRELSISAVMYTLVGVVLVMLIGLLPENLFMVDQTGGAVQFLLLFAAGVIAAIALILPGISVSYMLLMLGIYEATMKAISNLDILFLLPLALGVGVGIIMTTRILEKAMEKYPQPVYLIILGFILGSAVQIFPGIPHGFNFLFCLLLLIMGALIIMFISGREEA